MTGEARHVSRSRERYLHAIPPVEWFQVRQDHPSRPPACRLSSPLTPESEGRETHDRGKNKTKKKFIVQARCAGRRLPMGRIAKVRSMYVVEGGQVAAWRGQRDPTIKASGRGRWPFCASPRDDDRPGTAAGRGASVDQEDWAAAMAPFDASAPRLIGRRPGGRVSKRRWVVGA